MSTEKANTVDSLKSAKAWNPHIIVDIKSETLNSISGKKTQDGADIWDDCSAFSWKNLKINKTFLVFKEFINKISFFNMSDMIYSLCGCHVSELWFIKLQCQQQSHFFLKRIKKVCQTSLENKVGLL